MPSRDIFSTIRSEGALLPPDLLHRIANGDAGVGGLGGSDYHLVGERVGEAVSRSWNRLLAAWQSFREASGKLPATDIGTSVTRERWLLPLFSELGYGRLQTAKALEAAGRTYPVSHGWHLTPIHLVGHGADLDRRSAGVAGASRVSPHGLVQDLLNRSEEHLWGILSNGLKLRVLRDSRSLVRQAYVEFDLESMMEGQVYADFVVLWLLCHQSRVEAARPEDCWLERWTRVADEQGTRALDHLRDGVEAAIQALGQGFLQHRANRALLERLRTGDLSKDDYYRQLLRTVYRLIFLFVAEDRDFLFAPGTPEEAKERFRAHYSTARLRSLAERRRGTRHVDLWRGVRVVFGMLKDDVGCPALGLPALNSFLWSLEATADLTTSDIQNTALLEAVRSLAFTAEGGALRAIDFRNLGPEELGSVYESLLELHPNVNADAGVFTLGTAGGNERKTTGSYYTPDSLIQQLLDTALDPVLDRACKAANPEAAIQALKVVDPSCGSGHFLIGAAHRIAKRLAAIRTGEDEPSPAAVRHALRDVIGRCIYGVDINPMAVELCKVGLWMEALEPGKPLSFLDHRILVGNALLGATPALLAAGIPDEAFTVLEGDDRPTVTEARKRNKKERDKKTLSLFGADLTPWDDARLVAERMALIGEVDDSVVAGIHEKQRRYEEALVSDAYQRAKLVADAWCAAFVWERSPGAVPPVLSEALYRAAADMRALSAEQRAEVRRLAGQYQFFHWHLAFPDVFTPATEDPAPEVTGWTGGFDAVLGNPPWERMKLEEREWFASRSPAVARARNTAERSRAIAALRAENPALHAEFLAAQRFEEQRNRFVRASGLFPFCGRGDVNTYSVFAELAFRLSAPEGRTGIIVPTGIATDDTTKFFFQHLVDGQHLVSLFDFENRERLFPAVAPVQKFSLLTTAGRAQSEPAHFAFFLTQPAQLQAGDAVFRLRASDIALLNPNTRTCPTFRSRRDAEVVMSLYRGRPVLFIDGPPEINPWGISQTRMFDSSNDSGLFRTKEYLEDEGFTLHGNLFTKGAQVYRPLYEAKLIQQYNHRLNTYEGVPEADRFKVRAPTRPMRDRVNDPSAVPLPRFWVNDTDVARAWPSAREWVLAYRKTGAVQTNRRSCVSAVLPRVAVSDKAPLLAVALADPTAGALLLANLNSVVFDYALRQKLSGADVSLFVLKQTPVVTLQGLGAPGHWAGTATLADFILPRVLELTFTAWDVQPFALDCGYDGPPFPWDEHRRLHLRAELDALFLHLYGVSRPDAEHILDSFRIVARQEVAQYGEYRSRRLTLSAYEAMATARSSGSVFLSPISPSPAHPSLCTPQARAAAAATVGGGYSGDGEEEE